MPADFAALRETIRRCAAILRDAHVRWALGGSVAAWARGGPQTCNDLDVVVAPADAARAQDALAAAGLRPEQPPEEWLLKAWDGDVLVDLIFQLTGVDVPAAIERATDGSPYARAFLTLVAELGVVGTEAAPRP